MIQILRQVQAYRGLLPQSHQQNHASTPKWVTMFTINTFQLTTHKLSCHFIKQPKNKPKM
jgi:hypothetical protein